MVKKLLGAAAIAVVAHALVPAYAAKVAIGCSGDNVTRAEGTIETMADGPAKFTAQREIAQAQGAMLNGKMSVCAMHLARAMHASHLAPAAYQGSYGQSPYPGTMAQSPGPAAPGQTVGQAPYQGQPGWKPLQPAQ